MALTYNRSGRACARGAAALEFALVFPVLFLMMYAMLSYALIFAAQHALANSAAEGSRAAVRFTSLKDTEATRKAAACAVALQGVAWLGTTDGKVLSCSHELAMTPACTVPSGSTQSIQCLAVHLRYEYAQKPLIPLLPLLPVPQALTGSAVTQIALTY